MVKNRTLEDRITLKLIYVTVIVAFIATVGNYFTHLYLAAIVTAIATIFYYIIYKLSKSTSRNYLTNNQIVISYYLYLTILWFYNGGSTGSTILLFVILFFVTFIIIPAVKHKYYIGFSILLIFFLYSLEFYFPNSIRQEYISKTDRFIDISIVAVIVLIMLKNLTDIIKKSYESERDLVKQKNLELEKSKKELEDSKDFFNKLAENLPGISYKFKMNKTGKPSFSFISGAVFEIFEVTPEQVYQNRFTLFKMVTDDTLKELSKYIKYTYQNLCQFKREHRIVTPSGKVKYILTQAKPEKLSDGSVVWYGYSYDITDRKNEEEKLLASEGKFRFISENTSDGIVVIEKTGITYVSKSYTKMFGYTEAEQKAKTEEEILNFIHPHDRENVLTAIYNAESLKQEKLIHEYRYLTKKGNYIWREDTTSLFYDENGISTKYIIVVRDITDRIEKQKELATLSNVTADQNKRLLNFTYIISHNIRSHSANLSGLINLIEHTEIQQEKEEYFKMLKTSTNKLEETIQNLNEIISVQNNLNQAKSILNLKDEVNRTFLVVNDIILESKFEIKNQVHENVNIEVIPAYLDSILLNLITNAIKYRSPERTLTIHISSKNEGDYEVLNINDNGLGLDLAKFKHKLFGMYKTFHNNANARGIGLFITKNQIEAMNGKIEIESEVNVGTTFKIYFPNKQPTIQNIGK